MTSLHPQAPVPWGLRGMSLDTKSCFPAGGPWRGTSLMSRPSGRILPYSAFPPHLGALPSRPTSSYLGFISPAQSSVYWAWLPLLHHTNVCPPDLDRTDRSWGSIPPISTMFFLFFFLGMATLVTIGLKKKFCLQNLRVELCAFLAHTACSTLFLISESLHLLVMQLASDPQPP